MTLNQLQYFEVAARELHFGRAAKQLCISQPSLSIALSNLEDELEVQLFEKSGRGVVLTDAGRILQEQAARILEQVSATRRRMEIAREDGDMYVSLAYVSTMAVGYIPRILQDFLRQYQGRVRLRTDEVPTPGAVQGLKEGKYDLALCLKADNDPDIEQTCIYRAPYVLIVPEDCPLTEQADIREVARYPFVTYRVGPPRTFVETLFRRAGAEPDFCHYTYSDDAIFSLVERGIGVSIVDHLPGIESRRVRILHMPWLEGRTHDIYLTRRTNIRAGRAVRQLQEYILEHVPQR